MKKLISLSILSVILIAAGCNVEGEPVDYAKACDRGNNKKTVETKGFLDIPGMMSCSNTSGRMECGFKLRKAIGDEEGFSADVAIGSGANTMDKVERGFAKSDVKVRADDGTEIDLTKAVTVTGEITSVDDPTDPSGGVCYMKVYKLEQ